MMLYLKNRHIGDGVSLKNRHIGDGVSLKNRHIGDGVALNTKCNKPLSDFVITVKTDNVGDSADNEFILPVYGDNYQVVTSEGAFAVNSNANGFTTFSWP